MDPNNTPAQDGSRQLLILTQPKSLGLYFLKYFAVRRRGFQTWPRTLWAQLWTW